MFRVLQSHNVIKVTPYWTSINVAVGLQALCTSVEMVAFSLLMLWSFSSAPYRAMRGEKPHTNSFMAFLHSQNYWDFVKCSFLAVWFSVRYAIGRPDSHTSTAGEPGFDEAFGVRRSHRYFADVYRYGNESGNESGNEHANSRFVSGSAKGCSTL